MNVCDNRWILEEVQKYVSLLLTGEKELLTFMLMHEV